MPHGCRLTSDRSRHVTIGQPVDLLGWKTRRSGQIAGFSTQADRPVAQWLRGVNGLTSDDIHVAWIRQVSADFHPRFDAVSRRYTYLFHDQGRDNPFLNHLAK